jgi:hypothetical protein
MLWAKMLAGAIVGALMGYIMSRTASCSSGKCSARPPRIATILGGAVLGAAVAAYLAR